MTFNEWVKKYDGTQIDWDSVSPYQCVDLVKCYLQCVFGVITVGKGTSPWGNAKDYFNEFENKSWGGYKKLHAAGFIRIKNTPTFVPMKGDIVVWNNGQYGHIAVATGEGNIHKFWSYDQNWGGKYMHKVEHTYSFFLGVLRPQRIIKADVNVRRGAGLRFAKIGELKAGEKVHIYEQSGGWSRIGEDKWIATNYLRAL